MFELAQLDGSGTRPLHVVRNGALAVLCIVSIGAAGAEDVDPFALSPEQLFDATVMSASKSNEKLMDAPAAIFALSSEDIARSGATSVPEALRLVPGVHVARGGASSWAISVRGMSGLLANKLLVLVDGREVYDTLFSGVYWDIQDLTLEDVERIEVVRGPGATLWGANAVNGVINIITKRASDTHGELASVVAGNKDRAIVTGRTGASDGAGAHWRVHAKYVDRPSEDSPAGTDAQDDWRVWRGGFRADWDEDAAGDAFTLQGDLYESNKGDLRVVPQLTPPYAVTVKEHIAARGANLLGRWTHDLDGGEALTVQAYVDLTSREQLTLENQRTVLDVEAQWDGAPMAAHQIVAGGRYRFSKEDLIGSSIIAVPRATRRDDVVSAFVQDKITLQPDSLFLTVGSKFEHNDYTGFEMQPSARLHWVVGADETAWASVSRAVRTPNMLEHDFDIVSGVIPPGLFAVPILVELIPSPGFESEELIAYEAGWRRRWSDTVSTDVAVFYNAYDKLATLSLQLPDVGGPPPHFILPIMTTNLTRGRTVGGETAVTWRAAENLQLSAAYSYIDIELDGPPASAAIAAEAAEDQSPQHQFNLRSQWDATKDLSFDATLHHVGGLPWYGVDAYWRLDARVGWRLSDQVQLELVGQNLFDDSHREFGAATDVSAAEIGRAVYGRLTWRS